MTSFEGLLKSSPRGPLAYLTLSLLMAPPALVESASTLDIGDRRQVFIDHRFLESSQGVRLRVHPPRKTGEMTIAQEHPWESRRVGLYGTVLKVGETYHMWYESLSNFDRDEAGHHNPEAGAGPERLAPLHVLRTLSRWDYLEEAEPGAGRIRRQPEEQHRGRPWRRRNREAGLRDGLPGPQRSARATLPSGGPAAGKRTQPAQPLLGSRWDPLSADLRASPELPGRPQTPFGHLQHHLLGRPNPKVRRLCETERSGARPTPDQRPQ